MSRYATPSDFQIYGLPSAVTSTLDTEAVQTQLDAASNYIDGYLLQHYDLPLLPTDPPPAPPVYPQSLVQKTCEIAAWHLLRTRGFDPNNGSHITVRMTYEDALKWCRDLSDGRVTLAATVADQPVDSAQGSEGGAFAIQTRSGTGLTGFTTSALPSSRGWR